MNYYERHIGDYLKDTAHLSLLEHGVYGRLLDVYYTRECGIGETEAARLVGAKSKEERVALESVLAEFFTRAEGTWTHGRCDAEIERYRDKQRKASASANARWQGAKSHTERNANAMRTHSEGNAPNHQTPDTKEENPPTPRKRGVPPPDGVSAEVWESWLELRRKKRAPVTETVIASARAEADKARMTLDAFLAVWCFRGSQGLMADWLKPEERRQGAEPDFVRQRREQIRAMSGGLASARPIQPETVDVSARIVG